jgi:hypothetical protein
MRRGPEGIIDDLFLPAGKKVVHEVRTGVREIIRKAAKAEQKNKKAQQFKTSQAKRWDKEFAGVKDRMTRNIDRKATPAGKQAAGERTRDTALLQKSKIQGSKTPRKVESAKTYQKDLDKFSSSIKKRFPNEEAFQRALKEEARDLRKAKNVVAAQKTAPAKKAPVKKAPAKKAPAKKAAAPKAPKNVKGK